MLRFLSKYLKYSSRTQKKSIDFDELQQKRRFLMEEIATIYSSSVRPHEDRVYEEVLYGRKCNIVGLTPNSQQSATYIKSICLGLTPDHVIMGGFNSSRLISDRIAKTMQEKRSVRGYDTFIQPSKLFCKTLITPLVTKLIEQDPNYCVDEQKQTVYIFDHKNKHVHASNYLTIMNRILHHEFSKISFGMPSDYIIFEDLMINETIQTLRNIFDRVVLATKQNKDKNGIPQVSMDYYPDLVLEEMRYHAVFQPVLSKKQLTYTTALLNKSVSTSQRVMLFVQNHYLEQVAENVHKITIDPKQVYRGGCTNVKDFINNTNSEAGIKINQYLYAENKELVIDQLIEKMIILNQLKNHTLENELLVEGLNIFNKTVFAQLFEKMNVGQIQERYKRIKRRYARSIGQIIQKRVNATATFKEPQKNFYTLTQMIKTQQQRNLDFPPKIEVINYETIKQQKIDMTQINKQIEHMVKKQLSHTDKEMMQSFFSGDKTRENVVLFQKLLVQAKLRLNKTNIKLPVYHYGAMSAIFKDQIQNSMLNSGKKKTQHQFFLDKIQDMKQKGVIREVQSEQELKKIVGLDGPRLSFQFDDNGDIVMNEDGKNVESVQKMLKNNDFMKEMFDMDTSVKDEEQFYKQEDEKETKPIQEKSPSKPATGFKRKQRK